MFRNDAGKEFNGILLLERQYDRPLNSYPYYKAKCRCGKEFVCRLDQIKNPKFMGCEECKYVIKVGDKYNKLLVLEKLGNRGTSHVYWKCQCECGNLVEIDSNRLSKAKGCRRCSIPSQEKHFHWQGYKEISKSYWNIYEYNSKNRNLSFNISREQIWEIYEKQNRKCILSDLDISFIDKRNHKIKEYPTASIDRIDNNIGYEIDNVQIVHKDINRIKSNLSMLEFINIAMEVTKPIENHKINTINDIFKYVIYHIFYGANNRNIEIHINKEDIISQFNKQYGRCSLTNKSLYLPTNNKEFNKHIGNASLDRIDSNKGYTVDNIEWIDKRLNKLKSVYHTDYYKYLLGLVYNVSQQKSLIIE